MTVVEQRCILFQKYLFQLQRDWTHIFSLTVLGKSPESLPGVEVILTPKSIGLVCAAAHFQPTWINCAAPIVCGHPHGTAARGV